MSFFDDIGGFINSITSPAGIKLFPGGPYPDAALGDVQQKQMQQYLAQLAPIIAQIAGNAGVTNPQTPGQPGEFSNNMYGLSGLQQGQVNQQAGVDRAGYDQILARVKANLSARGMGDSSTMAAAEAYLGQQLQGQLGSERVQAGQNAYDTRVQALQMIGQLLGQGYGAQQQVTNTQRQEALQSHQNSMQQLGALLALGLHYGGVGQPSGGQAGGGGVLTGAGSGGAAPGVGVLTRPNNDAGVPNIYPQMAA